MSSPFFQFADIDHERQFDEVITLLLENHAYLPWLKAYQPGVISVNGRT
jgi:hypothetical protein